jgi:transcriptional regulator with XRE-family HTH domain
MKVLAERARLRRKERKLSQQTLAKLSGVSFGSIKRFERLGEISLKSLLRIALVMGQEDIFDRLFRENIVFAFPVLSSTDSVTPQQGRLAIFKHKNIRQTFHNNDWWFCLTDIVSALLRSRRARHYLLDIRRRDHSLARLWPNLVKLLPLETSQGKHKLLCINTVGFFRLIQSMPNKQVEHWRLWLAQVAYERVCEIENPLRAIQRIKDIYKAKGFSESQIVQKISETLSSSTLENIEPEAGEREFALFMEELGKKTPPIWQ